MKNRIVYLCIVCLLWACNPYSLSIETDDNGVITRKPFLWKSGISDGVLGFGLYRGYVIDGMGVLCVAMRKSPNPYIYGESFLQLKNIHSGADIWTWDEFFDEKLRRSLNRSIIVYDNKLILHDVRADYCIDTKTGKTIWKKQRGFVSASELAHIGSRYFISGQSPASVAARKVDDSIYAGDFETGELEEILKPPYSDEYAAYNGERTYYGSIYRFNTFQAAGEAFLLLPYDELGPRVKYNNARSFFGLYNLTFKKWVYDRMPLSLENDGSMPSLMPVIEGNRVFMTSLNSIGCFDLWTGKRIWQKRMTDEHTGFQDFIKINNRLVISGHDGNLYCVNADNGAKLWTEKSGALTSDIYFQDGVLYGIRGDELRANDVQTGRLLWRMLSEDGKTEKRTDSKYGGFVTGTPSVEGKKGRIYATTSLNLYCFEAVL